MSKNKTRQSNILKCNGKFISIPHELILSKEFNSLSSSAIRIYIILLTRWSREKDKIRNKIIFTYEELHEITKMSTQTISNAIKELEKANYLDVIYGGKNNPNRYEITYNQLQ